MRYESIGLTEDIDKVDENGKIVGEHLAIELHRMDITSILPTHLLKIYYDIDKVVLCEITTETQEIKGLRPKKKLKFIVHKEIKVMTFSDLKIEHK